MAFSYNDFKKQRENKQTSRPENKSSGGFSYADFAAQRGIEAPKATAVAESRDKREEELLKASEAVKAANKAQKERRAAAAAASKGSSGKFAMSEELTKKKENEKKFAEDSKTVADALSKVIETSKSLRKTATSSGVSGKIGNTGSKITEELAKLEDLNERKRAVNYAANGSMLGDGTDAMKKTFATSLYAAENKTDYDYLTDSEKALYAYY